MSEDLFEFLHSELVSYVTEKNVKKETGPVRVLLKHSHKF